MFFSGLMTYFLITSWLAPGVLHGAAPLLAAPGVIPGVLPGLVPGVLAADSFLLPTLLHRIHHLEHALRWAPRIAFGAAVLGQGAIVIGGRVFRNYLEWRKTHPPTYDHIKLNKGHYSSDGDGWTISNVASPGVHEAFERTSNRLQQFYHRTFDFLAFSRDINRDKRKNRRERLLNAATEYLFGWGPTGKQPAVLLAHEPVQVVPAPVPVPVVEEVHYKAAPPPYVSSYKYGPPSPHISTYEGPSEYVSSYEGPSEYVSSPYAGPPEYVSSPYAGPPEYVSSPYGGPSGGYVSSSYGGSSHGHGGYYSSPEEAGHVYLGSGSSTSPRRSSQSKPMSKDEFKRLMSWASGSSLQGPTSSVRSQGYGAFKPMPASPARKQGQSSASSRNVRIKRKSLTSATTTPTTTEKPKEPESTFDRFMSHLSGDVGRFFTVVEYLDENKCLQKLVCNVHSKNSGMQDSMYATHLVNAFQMLETFMPSNDESYLLYREAAKLGSNSTVDCSKQFNQCKYSARDIIGFSDDIEEKAEELEAKTTTAKSVKSGKGKKEKKTSTKA